MRITGGVLRGRRVAVPEGIIRPAMDRMRESVFGALGDLTGLSFLDIFSGSGIIALEAASRGANPVEAVEKDKRKGRILLENVSIAPIRINCRFMAAELYVKRAGGSKNTDGAGKNFDIIFCDPPFPYQYKWELAAAIASSALMNEGSRFLIHHPREENSSAAGIKELNLIESREYGRSVVDFFVKYTTNENL